MEEQIKKDKYYTPEIEEFHVGFEYEGRLAGVNGGVTDWEKRIFYKEQLPFIKGCEETLKHFRVRYIDKEDLVSMGFSLEVNCGNELGEGYSRYVYGESRNYPYIVIDNFPETEKFRIFELFAEGGRSINLFSGTINNKSELKKLIQQLGI
jgi:hypothetical protein